MVIGYGELEKAEGTLISVLVLPTRATPKSRLSDNPINQFCLADKNTNMR
jgi:hypothetical protein